MPSPDHLSSAVPAVPNDQPTAGDETRIEYGIRCANGSVNGPVPEVYARPEVEDLNRLHAEKPRWCGPHTLVTRTITAWEETT